MDKLEVVGWRAEWTGLNGKVASSLYDTKSEAKEAARWMAGAYEPLTPLAPAQAEIDRLREEVARLTALNRELEGLLVTQDICLDKIKEKRP